MDRTDVDKLIREIGLRQAGGKLGVAALLYTYCCTIACRHCCFGCAGSRPRVWMATDKAVEHLRQLHELGRVIHIAGGECMMFWPQLQEVLTRSAQAGVQPQFLESNCSFAVSDELTRERFEFIRNCGVAGMLFSSDCFHQAFVPPESFLRARRIAGEIFGPANLWCSDEPEADIRRHAEVARDEALLRERVSRHPPKFVGSAQREFAAWLPQYPPDEVPPGSGWRFTHEGWPCMAEFEARGIWEIHIDPYDNMQTNCGVILGNASRTPVSEMMRAGPENANFVVSILAREGALSLARFARDRHGFAMPERVASKCDLCFRARSFLRSFYPDILGPAEVYDP